MIARLIRGAVKARVLILLIAGALALAGLWALRTTSIDALPDLSDVQVILRTSYPGQAPQIVENQVTYPLTTTMLSVPGARTVRGVSFFGDSFVYVLFGDGTDPYWARSRVLEYLNQVQGRLPLTARASLGPDATGIGWIFEYALVDRTGAHDLSQLRALQDWFLKYELKTVPDVAEVASIGGMVKQYQVVVDPARLVALGIPHQAVVEAIRNANQEAGGSAIELAETEFVVRASGYLQGLDDFRLIPIKVAAGGVPVRLGDVAHIQLGPEMRRGVSELNGEGEVAGGVVILRSGKNARKAIAAVKEKLEQLKPSLPAGVEIVTAYDRSHLIDRAVENLSHKLIEEFIVVALVCALFLWHLRSALVAVISLPLGVLVSFLIMRYQGVSANIMSLGGVAIAIGAMVDAAIVMIENAHKRLERWTEEHGGQVPLGTTRWDVITNAAVEVGPALFVSLLIITLSFIPVFALQAQEGRLFGPLAMTKTYAMAAAAGLSISLVPVLMGYWIRGPIPSERANPVNRGLIAIYRPILDGVLRHPWATLCVAAVLSATALWPLTRIGGEFIPPLDEGDLLYMPSALPGLSASKASELLQLTDRMIKAVPEVETVFGKAGRAESATDPAPIEMFETTVRLKPRDQWRAGITTAGLIAELDAAVKVPGLTNLWVPPIRNRIDMLATGIKSPVGIKVSGSNLSDIDAASRQIERIARNVPGVASAVAERLTDGRYVQIDIDRVAASRFGLNVSDVQSVIASGVGGENIGETVEGLARYPINVRYPRELRDSIDLLRNLPIVTSSGQRVNLGAVASLRLSDGPPMIKTENARLSGWIYVDVRGRDLASTVRDLKVAIASQAHMAVGTTATISGQFEYLERASQRLKVVVPATLAIILVLLYFMFGTWSEAVLIMATLPIALTGGVWFLYILGYDFSIATGVGFIALAGLAAEFGVVMLVYLKHAIAEHIARDGGLSSKSLDVALREGAVLRVRPKAMTVAVIVAGLLPIFWGEGTGSEIMTRIAAPMVGGMLSAPLLSMLVIPAAYLLMHRRKLVERHSTVTAEEQLL